MRRVHSAFSLIELLLVVTIIVILIALLQPALMRTRIAANEARCQANMHEIANGTLSYANDNNACFPANRYRPNPAAAQHVTWRWLVIQGGYVSDGQLWICPGPSPTAPKTENGVNIHGSQCIGDIVTNYAYNGSAFWRFSPTGAPDGSHPYASYGIPNEKSEPTTRSARRSTLFLLLETRDIYPDIGDWARSWAWADGGGIIGFWHRRGANWAMVDGSVRWSKLLDTANPTCWWHNWPEPAFSHLSWVGEVPAMYQ